jgi:hypothetical protein
VFSEITAMGRYDYKYDDTQPLEPIDESTIEHSMGEVIIWFEALDDAVSAAIAGILNRGDVIGRVVTTPLSFRLKVEMFSNLFKADRPTSSIAEVIDDLCAACLQIEEERNKIVHAKWARALTGGGMKRSKFSTKMKHACDRRVRDNRGDRNKLDLVAIPNELAVRRKWNSS